MSIQSRTTTITAVTKKDTSKGELFVIAAGDGTDYSTFQGALANQAYALIGQTVDLRYTEKTINKDGRSYTNRYYEGAQASQAGQAPQLFQPVTPTTGSGVTITGSTFGTSPAGTIAPETGRELKIMRQTATKVAAHLLIHLPEAERTPTGLLAMADFLVDYYEHGVSAATIAGDPGPATIPPPHTDDDIPFAPTIDGFQ